MRIAVCDDEEVFRNMLMDCLQGCRILAETPEILQFSSGEELLEAYEKNEKFDLLFLDVEMKGISGLETGNRIRKLDSDALIIFVTSHRQFVPDAFRINAFQFLVKPVKQEDIDKELERAVEKIKKNKGLYQIEHKGGVHIIEIKDILYVDVLLREISIHTTHGIYKKNGKLKEEIKVFQPYDFVQYSKSGIVNMENITGIEADELIMRTGEKVRMSKNYKSEVRKRLSLYIGGRTV